MSRYRKAGLSFPNSSDNSLPSTPKIEKHPYVLGARVLSEYTDTIKDLVRTYNSLRAKLIEAGLMEEKS